MKKKQEDNSQDIELDYNSETDEIIFSLSNDGIDYFLNIFFELKNAEVDSHWHVDDFSGWLGGKFKHLIIMKK